MARIAVLGCGTVGASVVRLLEREQDWLRQKTGQPVSVKYICKRRFGEDFPWPELRCEDFSIIENDPEISVVAELIGGVGAARDYCERALRAGKHVVTANKQLIAACGPALFRLAQAHGVTIRFEAAVGGGIPVLRTLSRSLCAAPVRAVTGILNGTTNFILTQMLENGMSYEAALAQAQALGYAEADPTADVEGLDAARKLCILSGLAFGTHTDCETIMTQGVTAVTELDAAFARALGMKIKLLGRSYLENGRQFTFVAPHFVPEQSPLAHASGADNAILLETGETGDYVLSGPGAGGFPTANAVVGDLVDILRSPAQPQPERWSETPARPAPAGEVESCWFFRTDAPCGAAEACLGPVRWSPEISGAHGGVSRLMALHTLLDSGLQLSAVYPVL